jgi:HTH-type transcriptional regulator, competence development regulator
MVFSLQAGRVRPGDKDMTLACNVKQRLRTLDETRVLRVSLAGAQYFQMGKWMSEQELQQRTVTLGKYLASIRDDRKLTLRQVEEATGREVSNAYLSQLENDKIKQPSPHILHVLADLYSVSYTGLMERAGYLKPSDAKAAKKRHGRAATFADMDLSSEEEAELLRFLRFIRADKTGSSAS